MKKIYSIVMGGLMMLSVNLVSAQAPSFCPGAFAFNYNLGGQCVVTVSGMPANTPIGLMDPTNAVIAYATTEYDGSAIIVYDCSKAPSRVATLVTSPASCSVPIPPQAVLPMKLSAFTAELKTNNTVSLKWTSTLELSSFKYVVQKSNDGLNFSDIGEVAAAGNSVNAINYNFSDNNFISGASYFRLKQIDIDGKSEFSKTVYVNNTKGAGAITSIRPNPFVSDVQLIGISSAELNAKTVQVYNSFGQRVSYRIAGSNAIEIDRNAAKGVYILKVKDQTFKLVKN